MSSKLYLSATKIKTYLSCKRKFKLMYIDRLTSGDKKTSKYLSFGNSMHLALADFNRLDDEHRTLDNIHDLLRKNWIREGYSSREEEREFGLWGLDMLTQYFKEPKDIGKNLIIEEMIYMDVGDFILCGKIDKTFSTDDGEYEVVDYKTSKTIAPIDNIQLPIYLLLTNYKLKDYPNKVSLYYLSENKKVTNDVDKSFIDNSTKDIFNICDDIMREDYFEPTPNSYCKSNCQYYEICDEAKNEKVIILSYLRKMRNDNKNDRIF